MFVVTQKKAEEVLGRYQSWRSYLFSRKEVRNESILGGIIDNCLTCRGCTGCKGCYGGSGLGFICIGCVAPGCKGCSAPGCRGCGSCRGCGGW